jgi:hypothetical protein
MDQLNDYADARLLVGCVHCAGTTGTRDHMPSRVLLDEPYPRNLPVVPACHECNAGFSLDEEYLACLIKCARTGSVHAAVRPKVGRILYDRPALRERLRLARTVADSGEVAYSPEADRIRRVVLKLARGHAAYELCEQRCVEPSHLMAMPLHSMTTDTRRHFEKVPSSSVWPEVGTRAMQRMVISVGTQAKIHPDWIEVQEERYRYFAFAERERVLVRIVIGEYLACEVIWGDERFDSDVLHVAGGR